MANLAKIILTVLLIFIPFYSCSSYGDQQSGGEGMAGDDRYGGGPSEGPSRGGDGGDGNNNNTPARDTTFPTGTVSYSPNSWTNGSIIVTVACSDDRGCARATYPKTVNYNHRGTIAISDNAGNTTNVPYNVAYIDKIIPTGTVSYSPPSWTNGSVVITVACSDVGSGCASATYTETVNDNESGTIAISDNVGNTTNIPYNVSHIDTIIPRFSDITGGTVVDNDDKYIYANSAKTLSLEIDNNGGSPIASVTGTINSIATTFSKTGNTWYTTVNISDVDSIKNANNYGVYELKITEIKDEAGNYMLPAELPTYTYNVYANIIDTSKTNIISSDLTDIKILDGEIDQIKISIEDEYYNDVVPVKKADGTTVRNVVFDIDYSNNLYLNQYTQSGDSAVYMDGDEILIGDRIETITKNNIIQTKDYVFDFKTYSPTNVGNGGFQINPINIDTTEFGNPAGYDFSSSSPIVFNYNAPYRTSFSGELFDNGITEGGAQESNINFLGSCTNCSRINLSLEFGLANSEVSAGNITLVSGGMLDDMIIGEGIPNKTPIQEDIVSNNINYPIKTLLQLEPGFTVNDLENTYLSSHIGYTLGGKDITYNSALINPSISTTGLKVYGNTQSQQQSDIVDNQAIDDLQIRGENNKTLLKAEFRSNVFNFIRNLSPNTGTDITNLNSSPDVMYFSSESGENIILDTNAQGLVGKKTIIVKGGNLYIKSNTLYNGGGDILGIIVLKDLNGNGGNVYIDPSVTQISGTIFADKSIISYDGTDELDGNTLQSVLKNQLYIYGSIFTVNTIGGSRATPIECPYYITGTCSIEIAQKYDLNYLRRYYLISGSPANSGDSVFTSSDENYKYPVVIKYNPGLQISPPPLFSK